MAPTMLLFDNDNSPQSCGWTNYTVILWKLKCWNLFCVQTTVNQKTLQLKLVVISGAQVRSRSPVET